MSKGAPCRGSQESEDPEQEWLCSCTSKGTSVAGVEEARGAGVGDGKSKTLQSLVRLLTFTLGTMRIHQEG